MPAFETEQEREERTKEDLVLGKPLDYSYKKINTLEEDLSEKPREGRVKRTPSRGIRRGYLTKAIWLDNNCLTSIVGIEKFVYSMLEYPTLLGWIDFSFNNIAEIHEEILKFENLVILYLHGNVIENIETTFKLRSLPKLKRLTLQGNPICEIPSYRIVFINLLPQVQSKLYSLATADQIIYVQNLDFAPIVKRERLTSMPKNIRKKIQSI